MRTWLHRTAWSLLLMAIAIAAVRLALIARPMETGWETIASTCRDAALGWMGWKHTPISNREPSEQAEYWLREVDATLSGNPESAELCMGAAWVLDSPGGGFMFNYLKRESRGAGMPAVTQGFDNDALDRVCSDFEARCRQRCLALAERATELDPGEDRWWRMRAILLFAKYPMTTMYPKPRQDNWREVLAQCSQHDPQNALYDYLATETLWNHSAEVDWPDREDGRFVTRIYIKHEADFEEGIRRFEAGQKKPFLAIGEAGFPAITEFLARSELNLTDQAEVACNRLVAIRQSTLFHSMRRWSHNRAEDAEWQGDVAQQATMHWQGLRLFKQAIAPEETSAMKSKMHGKYLLPYAVVQLQHLAGSHPDLMKEDELDRLDSKARSDLAEAFVLERALDEMEKPRLAQQEAALTGIFVAMDAAGLAGLSLILSGIFLLIAMLLKRQASDPVRLGFLRHTTAWTIGIGLSVLLFGLMPAEIISREMQTTIATILAWGVVLTIVGLVVWKAVWLGRQRRCQYRILTLLGCMTAVAVFAWIWPVLAATVSWLHGLPPEFHVPAKDWQGIDAATLKASAQLGGNPWRWFLLQWNYYHGPHLAVLFSLGLVAIWSLRYRAKQASETVVHYWSSLDRARWIGLFRNLGTSALTAGLCALLVYLWLIPVTLRVAESQFEYRMRYCRNPADQIARIYAARNRVLASEEDMETIWAEVELHFDRARAEIADTSEGHD